jgi:hypothetical protein
MEWWSDGVMRREDGVLEYWSDGVMEDRRTDERQNRFWVLDSCF